MLSGTLVGNPGATAMKGQNELPKQVDNMNLETMNCNNLFSVCRSRRKWTLRETQRQNRQDACPGFCRVLML
jgi:hypothetical protein